MKALSIWMIISLSCINLACGPGEKKTTPPTISTAQQDSIALIHKKKIELERDSLLTKFKRNMDLNDITDTWWYEPKAIPLEAAEFKRDDFNNYYSKQMYICPTISTTGEIGLRSYYEDNNHTYHQGIRVRTSKGIVSSPVIPAFDKRNKQTNREYTAIEEILYGEGNDNGIVKYIAECDSTGSVTVSFDGRQDSRLFYLSKKEILAFKESYELSKLLKSLSAK